MLNQIHFMLLSWKCEKRIVASKLCQQTSFVYFYRVDMNMAQIKFNICKALILRD